MPYLVYDGIPDNNIIPVTHEDSGFYIGRSMENDVRLREDSSVSRKHCVIISDSERQSYTLRDLGSSNGTVLDGVTLRSEEQFLNDGDVFGVGNISFTFYSASEIPYNTVDTTTIYVQAPIPDITPPEEYQFKETTSFEAITPASLAASDEQDIFPAIDGFEFIRILGGGNYSTTYLTYHTASKQSLALKVFTADGMAQSQRDYFLQMMESASSLQHPHIMEIINAGATETLCYIAMPYAPQGTLLSMLEHYPGGIAEADAVSYILPLIDAMFYAYGAGMCHTDISPGNIFFNDASQLILADFGLPPWISEVFQANRTHFFGSTGYMPPEQTLDKSLDWTCDQYALGAVFFEMLTGHPPFVAQSAYALIEKHLREKIRFPSENQISDKSKAIITKMMAKTPDERFAGWGDIITAFKTPAVKSRKNMPLQRKGLDGIKRTGTGIKISAKKKPMTIRRK